MRIKSDTIHMPSKIAAIASTIRLVRSNLASASCVPIGMTAALEVMDARLYNLMERTAHMVDNVATVHSVAVSATTLLEHVVTLAYAVNLRMSEVGHPKTTLYHAQLRGATGLESHQIKKLYDKHELATLLSMKGDQQ